MGTLLIPVDPVATPVELPFAMTDEEFFEFCQVNRDLQIERTAEGEVLIMAPAASETSRKNQRINFRLELWAEHDGTGVTFGPDCGFKLPNGAVRSPDAAWVTNTRMNQLTDEQLEKFLPLCPDFVMELRSPSDRLPAMQRKMREYLDNGARLGWLLDPKARRVYVYKPGAAMECLEDPETLSGELVLPGFVLDVREIWNMRLRSS